MFSEINIIYIYGTNTYRYQNRVLGDATGEMGPFQLPEARQLMSWYNNEAWFVRESGPFFVRGAADIGYASGTSAGQFAFIFATGDLYEEVNNGSFRIILTPIYLNSLLNL